MSRHLHPSASRRHEAGLAMVLVAILFVVLFGFIGLAVDTAQVQAATRDLQDAADAAALAGARFVSDEGLLALDTYSSTREAAMNVAALNKAAAKSVKIDANTGNSAGGDIVVGTWNATTQTFTPTTVKPNAVRVVARRSSATADGAVPMTFGALFGVGSSDVTRTSIATSNATPNALIHVLAPSSSAAFSLTGDANLDVGNGKVQVNSSHSCSLKTTGSATLTAASVNTHGGTCIQDGSVQVVPKTYGDSVPDPLLTVLPTVVDWTLAKTLMLLPSGANGRITAAGTYNPGYYPKGLSLTSTTKVTLNPGTYLFGTSWSQTGQSQVTGSGVTLLFDQSVKLSIGGGASLTLTPPSSGAYDGLTMMFHRSTTGSSVVSVGGNGSIAFAGTLYCPAGGVSLTGTGAVNEFGQIVCKTLSATGTSDVTGLKIVPPRSGGTVALVK